MVALFAIAVTLVLEWLPIVEINLEIWINIGLILLIPMIIDGAGQYIFGKESTNGRRAVTGALFGWGIAMLTFLMTT